MLPSLICQANSVVGIDFGLVFSKTGVSILTKKGDREISNIPNKYRKTIIPSVICIVNDKIYYGEEALKKSLKYPKEFDF